MYYFNLIFYINLYENVETLKPNEAEGVQILDMEKTKFLDTVNAVKITYLGVSPTFSFTNNLSFNRA